MLTAEDADDEEDDQDDNHEDDEHEPVEVEEGTTPDWNFSELLLKTNFGRNSTKLVGITQTTGSNNPFSAFKVENLG